MAKKTYRAVGYGLTYRDLGTKIVMRPKADVTDEKMQASIEASDAFKNGRIILVSQPKPKPKAKAPAKKAAPKKE